MSDNPPSVADITRALTEVLIPAPGNRLPIPTVHRAVSRHLGGEHSGVPFKTVKEILRSVGISVRAPKQGDDHHAYGVELAPGVPDPELERKLRHMRRPSNRA
ncbi:hypothetical protein [Streptomyces chartreusis]|uniref:hypothetical protein n=1 Tax=Streptomyces chartreusis TaxID=1969 RepID=UPI00123D2207|nr:hypothetical protein [Streptomyces chartreusis]GGX12659.1 hypothetical protein GCM10010321_28950 [Streptomyces chartreusis]